MTTETCKLVRTRCRNPSRICHKSWQGKQAGTQLQTHPCSETGHYPEPPEFMLQLPPTRFPTIEVEINLNRAHLE